MYKPLSVQFSQRLKEKIINMNMNFFFRGTFFSFLLIILSCCSDDVVTNTQTEQVVMIAENFEYINDSRASFDITGSGAVFKWEANDVVGVFPAIGNQIEFPITEGIGTNTAAFDGGGWALKQSSTYAAYYPYNHQNNESKSIFVSYDGQEQVGNASTAHLGLYAHMIANATTPENGKVAFYFKHLSSLIELNIDVPHKGDVTRVGLLSNQRIFVNKGTCDLTSNTPCIKAYNTLNNIYLSLSEVSVLADKTPIKVYLMVAPSDFTGKNVELEIINNGESYKEPIALGKLEAGKAYRYNFTSRTLPETKNVIVLKEPGSLPELIGEENMQNYPSLKIIGDINGTDIVFLQRMMNINSNPIEPKGLRFLDLYDANIVSGGQPYAYADDSDDSEMYSCYTENDVIGDNMFSFCSNLEKIILPKTTNIIRRRVFQSCERLRDIVLPDKISSIGGYAFQYCPSLKTFKLPANIKNIEEGAFSGCINIEAFYGPYTSNDNKSIIVDGKLIVYAKGCTDVSFDIPNYVKEIGYNAFADSHLAQINIPSSVLSIGERAFSNCDKLTDINLPNSIQQIKQRAFERTSITSLTIPSSVSKITGSIVGGCKNLEIFTGKYTSKDGKYIIIHNSIIDYARGCKDRECYIDESVYSIGPSAFSESEYLESIKVTSPSIKVIKYDAFSSCMKLQSVELANSIENLGVGLFSNCRYLKTVKLPQSIEEIPDMAFAHCYRLESIKIPNGVKSVGNLAFFQCESFKTISFPQSVEYLGDQVFVQGGFRNLVESIYFYSVNPPSTGFPFQLYCGDDNWTERYCNIYVPAESVEIYKNTFPWNTEIYNKYNILPIPENEDYQ